ncbi:MAG TPA: TolC family protein [Chthoniobacteraceae bacterium]|nr:TolC family protein [Chthoniobacteraceae bacterium]
MAAIVAAVCCVIGGVTIRAGETILSGRAVTRNVSGALTIERAVQIALAQNPQILKALQEIERTRGQVIEIRAQALPHIGLTASYNQLDRRLIESGGTGQARANNQFDEDLRSALQADTGTNGNGQDGNDGTGQNNGKGAAVDSDQLARLFQDQGGVNGSGFGVNNKSWRVAIEVRQVLYAGGQVRAALKIAKFSEDSSYWSLRDVVDQIISRTRTQFYAALLNQALITVQEESIQLLTDQLRDQQNRFDAGTVPRFNVLRAEVELANARPELIRANNNYLIALLELAKTLGLEPTPSGKPAFFPVGALDVGKRPLGLQNALELAKERRPFLKVQRQSILIEAEQIKIALAGYKPRVDVNGGYEMRNSRLFNDLLDTVNGWFFGFNGSWDLFDGLETYGRTKQARARLASAKINYDDSVQQVELEVQQAYAQLQQARETIQSQQKNVESALEALRLANERLAAGAGTQLDVLDARVALTRARTTELQARADYNTALAEFDRVTATDTIYDDGFVDPLSRGARRKQTKKERVVIDEKKVAPPKRKP